MITPTWNRFFIGGPEWRADNEYRRLSVTKGAGIRMNYRIIR